ETAKELKADKFKQTAGFKMKTILLPLANSVNFVKLVVFAILIKDTALINEVSILSVVSNDEVARINIGQLYSILEDFVVQASASETMVDVTATIDHDVAEGIARKSKELIADLIVMGWPTSSSANEVIAEKMAGITNKTTKTVFLCETEHPWATQQKLIIAAPLRSEEMEGFELWVKKSIKIAEELSVPILVYTNNNTRKSIEDLVAGLNLRAPFEFEEFTDWDNFKLIKEKTAAD